VKRCVLAFAALLFAGATFADDEAKVVARVIDSSLERIPLQTIAPEYPRKARRDRIEGEVSICFEVDRGGRIRRAAVRYSSHRIFEKPSLRAVRASTFRALGKDEPVPAIKSCRTFIFSLQPAEPVEP